MYKDVKNIKFNPETNKNHQYYKIILYSVKKSFIIYL